MRIVAIFRDIGAMSIDFATDRDGFATNFRRIATDKDTSRRRNLICGSVLLDRREEGRLRDGLGVESAPFVAKRREVGRLCDG